MRPFVVILLSPAVDHTPGLLDRAEEPALQAPIAKHAIETLVMAVLPRTAGINTLGIDILRVPPRRDLRSNTLWTMVTLHLVRVATLGTSPLVRVADIACRDRPGTVESHALTRVFIQYRQALQPPPINGLVVDQIIAPDMVRGLCPGRRGRVDADGPPLARFLAHLAACALPACGRP
jgi:hypothetical protein